MKRNGDRRDGGEDHGPALGGSIEYRGRLSVCLSVYHEGRTTRRDSANPTVKKHSDRSSPKLFSGAYRECRLHVSSEIDPKMATRSEQC